MLVFQIMPGGNLLSLDAQGLKQLNRKLMSNPDNFLHEDLVLVNENNSDDLLLRNVTTYRLFYIYPAPSIFKPYQISNPG